MNTFDGKSMQVDMEFLANFVHQVVNPLNGVAGTLDNIADGVIKDESKKKQRLRAARAQLEQCITLMQNLAFLSQGFNHIQHENLESFIIPKLIIDAAMFYQEDGRKKNIKISLMDENTQNCTLGAKDLIRQVIMNIFDNCIKYSADDSTVFVDQRIQKKTNNVIISIKNTLPQPMAPGDFSRIFDRGFRGENARKSIASGTGLGLYICKKVVEDMHGGALTVQQHGALGLEFLIKIPRGISP